MGKRLFSLLLALTMLLGICAAAEEEHDTGLLRFDGVYSFSVEDTELERIDNYVLRFYPDGRVIDATVAQEIDKGAAFPKASWFDADLLEKESRADIPMGSYYVEEEEIYFYTESMTGQNKVRVEYHGLMSEDKIALDSKSLYNGFERLGMDYVFTPFDEIPGWED